MARYWEGDPEHWALISEVQFAKRQYMGGGFNPRGDQYVMVNPATGQAVPKEDLIYATKNLAYIYSSGMIREDRWAFLWYH